jgi:putative ABC transport system permease protein
MLRNYLQVAFRSLNRHRLYSLINILGLSIGLAAFFLIGLFVRQEQSFDRFHDKAERIFRVVQEQPTNMYLGSNHFAVTPRPLLEALTDEIPGVEASVQVNDLEALLVVDDQGFVEPGLIASGDFFHIFSFPLDIGNPEEALSQPDQIVLTRTMADRLFGSQDVIGRLVNYTYYSTERTLSVSGVMPDPPSNSQLQFDYVVSYQTNTSWAEGGQWGNNSYITYGLSSTPLNVTQLDASLATMVETHMSGLEWIASNPERLPRFYVQPLTDIHLHSRVNFDLAVLGDIRYVRLFTVVAFLILLTACINYMNLATARSAVRAREVGIRKVSGADRLQLIRQFLGESLVTSMIAVAGAFLISLWALGPLGQLLERDMSVASLIEVGPILFLLGTALLVGVLAGSWPAFFMSSMQPSTVLKGAVPGHRRSILRNVLVVGQFGLGIILVVGVVVIQKQMAFVDGYDTGLVRDQIVSLRVRDSNIRDDASTLLESLEAVPGVRATSTAGNVPVQISSNTSLRNWEGAPEDASFHLWNTNIGSGFESMFDLVFVAGQGFSEELATDREEGIILNEAAIRAMGWTSEEAIGREIDFHDDKRIIGVVRDFHFQSLREEIAPLALWHTDERSGYVLVRIDGSRTQDILRNVEAVWNQHVAGYPMDLAFLDDSFQEQYAAELRLGRVLQWFTILALIVAALGLFGLASYTAQQRTREIGIRKALGASAPSLVMLLSREFGRLVLIAFILGAPVAWFAMQRWLSVYAYKVDVGVVTLLLVGLSTALVAFASVGFQAVRASMADPVKSLRHEG